MRVSLTELQLFALSSQANERVFCRPTFYHFVLIVSALRGKTYWYWELYQGSVVLWKSTSWGGLQGFSPSLDKKKMFNRWVLKGVHLVQILLALLSAFPLYARPWLKNTWFISMPDGSHICHAVRPAVAVLKYLRWPMTVCFFLEDFHAIQNMTITWFHIWWENFWKFEEQLLETLELRYS